MFLDVQPCDSSAILELFSSQASHFTVTKAFEPSLPSDHMLKKERVLLDVFFLFVWVWFLFLFFLLLLFVFYKPIERTMTVHAGRRTDGLVRKKRPKRH